MLPSTLPSDLALDLLSIRQNFADFVRFAWPIREPARPLAWNWHIDLICDHVQKQAEWAEAASLRKAALLSGSPVPPHVESTFQTLKPYKRLLILISPGDLKSYLLSIFKPAWIWLRWPHRRALYFSHSHEIARDLSTHCRRILEHPSYTQLVDLYHHALGSPKWRFTPDSNERHNFVNSEMGHRLCFGFDQGFTGQRGDDLSIDDPVDAKKAIRSDEASLRDAFAHANNIIANQMQSRVNDMSTSTWTLMMQRLGEGDPADIAIADGDWLTLCLPKEFNPHHPLRHPADPRTLPGELLNPLHDDPAELARIKSKMGPRHYLAQYGQLTGSAQGGLFPRPTLASAPRYSVDPMSLVPEMDEIALSIDCTFKKTSGSDNVSLLVKGRKGYGRRFLLDRVSERLTFSETLAAALRLYHKWHPTFTIVEDKANGPAVLDSLQDAIPGLIPFNPGTSNKYERAQAGSAPLYAALQQVLPDRSIAPWIDDFINLHALFPSSGVPDDDIDAESQLDLYWTTLSRQAPWLSLHPPHDYPHPAYAHPHGLARHYVFSPDSLPPLTSHFLVPLVPHSASTYATALLLSSSGSLVGSASAPSTDALLSALVPACHHLAISLFPTAKSPLQPFHVLPIASSKETADLASRLASSRGFSVPYPPYAPTKATLASAAEATRTLLAHNHLRILDPALHALLSRATLNPSTEIPEIPRTHDTLHSWLPAPLRIDARLLCALAAFDTLAASHTSLVNRAARDAAKPLSYQDLVAQQYKAMYGDDVRVSVNKAPSMWSALKR